MYYAYYNSYGIGMRHESGGRIGHLRIFATAKERDAWVESEKWNGCCYKRESLTHRQAMPYLVGEASMYTCKEPKECRELGTTWMCYVIIEATQEGMETAEKYGVDW